MDNVGAGYSRNIGKERPDTGGQYNYVWSGLINGISGGFHVHHGFNTELMHLGYQVAGQGRDAVFVG